MDNSRQLDIFDPEQHQDKKIVIIGAGGIGSPTAYFLAQLGMTNITVVDYDEVEEHNINSQFYKESQLGEPKVEALVQNVKDFTGVDVVGFNAIYSEEQTENADIVIMAVDNMETRRNIVETADTETIIDGRMQGEIFMTYTFKPEYERAIYIANDWFPDEEADFVKCTEKAVSYNTAVIGGIVTRLVKGILSGEEIKYEYVFDLKNMILS